MRLEPGRKAAWGAESMLSWAADPTGRPTPAILPDPEPVSTDLAVRPLAQGLLMRYSEPGAI
jgi:hypothetical protein